ncbi:hypothetical protein [Pseudogemmobacter bohemicus]|uniref:hypothetical protein n=1 Tax=Pseudogemmobacter bohemicus TaxID=2250708 RepID=UPI00130037F2|nr:hypothetical protein [Pseudogemmobacter bohemicus]
MAFRLAALALVLVSGAAAAEERRPDPSYFTGVYERVGRSGAEIPALIDDLVRIAPTPEGWGLLLYSCAGGMQPDGWPIEFRPDEYGEVPNILAAKDGPFALWCQYFNDHSNYPILPCQSDMGAQFTLWPVTDERMTACLKAAGEASPFEE